MAGLLNKHKSSRAVHFVRFYLCNKNNHDRATMNDEHLSILSKKRAIGKKAKQEGKNASMVHHEYKQILMIYRYNDRDIQTLVQIIVDGAIPIAMI